MSSIKEEFNYCYYDFDDSHITNESERCLLQCQNFLNKTRLYQHDSFKEINENSDDAESDHSLGRPILGSSNLESAEDEGMEVLRNLGRVLICEVEKCTVDVCEKYQIKNNGSSKDRKQISAINNFQVDLRKKLESQDMQKYRNTIIEHQKLQREQIMRNFWKQYQEHVLINARDLQHYNIPQLVRRNQEPLNQSPQYCVNLTIPSAISSAIPSAMSHSTAHIFPLYNNPTFQPNYFAIEVPPVLQQKNNGDRIYLMQFLSCKIVNYFARISQSLPPAGKMQFYRILQKRNKDSIFELLKMIGYKCLLTEDIIEAPEAMQQLLIEQKIRNDIAMDLVDNFDFLDNIINACNYHAVKKNNPRMSYTRNFY